MSKRRSAVQSRASAPRSHSSPSGMPRRAISARCRSRSGPVPGHDASRRGIVGGDRRDPDVPEEGGDVVAVEPGAARCALGERRPLSGPRCAVRLDPAGTHEQDVADAQLDALGLGRPASTSGPIGTNSNGSSSTPSAASARATSSRTPRPTIAAPRHALDAEPACSGAADLVQGRAVVEAVLGVAEVAEGVPLARALQVEVVDVVVDGDARRPIAKWKSSWREAPPVEERRSRKPDLPVERKDLAGADQRRGGHDLVRTDEVQRAVLVVVAEHAPRRPLRRVLPLRQLGVRRQPHRGRDRTRANELLEPFLVLPDRGQSEQLVHLRAGQHPLEPALLRPLRGEVGEEAAHRGERDTERRDRVDAEIEAPLRELVDRHRRAAAPLRERRSRAGRRAPRGNGGTRPVSGAPPGRSRPLRPRRRPCSARSSASKPSHCLASVRTMSTKSSSACASLAA